MAPGQQFPDQVQERGRKLQEARPAEQRFGAKHSAALCPGHMLSTSLGGDQLASAPLYEWKPGASH